MNPQPANREAEYLEPSRHEPPVVPYINPNQAPEPLTRQELVQSCQGLVKSLAMEIHKRLPPYVELDDLICYGQLGLAEAASKYDPERAAKFSTYARYRIRGAIFDGLSKLAWFSRHHYHSSKYEQMSNDLLKVDSDNRGEGNAQWLRGTASALAVVYLATDREEDSPAGELIDDGSPNPQTIAIETEMKEKLREFLEALPLDAGKLIRGIYFEGLNIQEAGKRLGISKAWASRLHARTLDRLARALRSVGADD